MGSAVSAVRTTSRMLLAAVLAATWASPVQAWKYGEHHAITVEAFGDACKSVRRHNEAPIGAGQVLDALCRRDVIGCFAHMVATAGDIAADKRAFLGKRAHKFLRSYEEDCSDVSELASGVNIDPPLEQPVLGHQTDKLYTSAPARFFGFLDLVSRNTAHFQPKAQDEWVRSFEETVAIPSDSTRYAELLATYAFGMHYLEDSFAAGHNGVDRDNLRHDYDNAYHDDTNHTGIFLSDGTDLWHTYGDGRLDQSSLVSVLEVVNAESIGKLIKILLAREGLAPVPNIHAQIEHVVEVLSMPIEYSPLVPT